MENSRNRFLPPQFFHEFPEKELLKRKKTQLSVLAEMLLELNAINFSFIIELLLSQFMLPFTHVKYIFAVLMQVQSSTEGTISKLIHSCNFPLALSISSWITTHKSSCVTHCNLFPSITRVYFCCVGCFFFSFFTTL